MIRKLIAANWKENPKSERRALELFRAIARKKRKNVDVVLCPPFIYLEEMRRAFARLARGHNLALGAQDAFWQEKGPYTSEIGPRMLRSLGIAYVIVGHSERRKWMKETDAMIGKKIALALKDGLKVIVCVGEPLAVRRKGIAAARKFVARQLKLDLKAVGRRAKGVAVAYEPIWAIGTGRYDRPEDAAAMTDFIRSFVKKIRGISPRVLYGGSVNSRNIGDYVQYKSIDGALVGGASLDAAEFNAIISITQHAYAKH